MKTKYRFIEFSNDGKHNGRDGWNCRNRRSGALLAIIVWYPAWRQFIFTQAEADVVWSADCLNDVLDFMGQLYESK